MNEAQNKKLLLIDATGNASLAEEERGALTTGQWRLVLNQDHSQLPLAYPDQSWDAVIWRLEEDATNIKPMQEEAYRLIGPGGRVILIGKLNTRKKTSAINVAESLAGDVEVEELAGGRFMIMFDKQPLLDSGYPASNTTKGIINENSLPPSAASKDANYVSTAIGPNATSGYFGHIDLITKDGVSGWLLNAENFSDPIAVSILLDDELIGTAYTAIFRADIARIIDHPVNSGLHFKWQKAKLPAWIKERDPEEEARLHFVIEGSGQQLPVHILLPTIGELRTWVGSGKAPALSGSQKKAFIQTFEGQRIEPELPEEVKAIAFYLPQFHPVPENDEWWGPGFTEWTNVTQAKPLFPGHYQPHVPADLGYYDLRLPEVREAQAELARKYGIYGFCYYYYWFAGRRILERPLQEVLESGTPDFPFCICWANENWSRRWDGSENEILLKQEHSEENDISFIHDVIPILKDSRYIRVNGKPILIVYRLSLLPDPSKTAELWRKICRDEGIGEIYLCAVESFGYSNPYKDGFDAALQFPPHDVRVLEPANKEIDNLPNDYTGVLYDYEEVVFNELNREAPNYKRFRGVMCSWDNTARKKKAGNVFLNATPEAYELWLRGVVDYTRANLPAGERLVFLNAWNEWAEGTHLEPDRKFGHGFLKATQRALGKRTDWRVLLEYARKKDGLSADEMSCLIDELNSHLQGYDQSLRYLTKLQKPLLRDMEKRAVFVLSSSTTISDRPINDGGECHLEQIGAVDVSRGFERWVLDRERCLYISGWGLAKGHATHEHTIDYFVLENAHDFILERASDRKQYSALAKVRYRRDDIVQVKTNYSEAESLFSGFRAYLDFCHINPGEYRLGIVHLGSVTNTISYFDGVLAIV